MARRQIGVRLLDVRGYEAEAVEFVRRLCYVTKESAELIVAAGPEIGLYASPLRLEQTPFPTAPIFAEAGWNVVSTTVQLLELPYWGNLTAHCFRLPATRCLPVSSAQYAEWQEYERRKLVRFVYVTPEGAMGDFSPADFLPLEFRT